MRNRTAGWHWCRVLALAACVVTCCSACSSDGKDPKEPPKQASTNADKTITPSLTEVRDRPAPAELPIGLTGNFKGFTIGLTANTEWEVTVTAGVGYRKLGINMPVFVFKTKEFSFAFVPDYNKALAIELELAPDQTIRWSLKDGFARQIGPKFTSIQGRFVFEVSTDLPKALAWSPSTTATLTFDKDRIRFTPLSERLAKDFATLKPVLPQDVHAPALIKLDDLKLSELRRHPPHVLRVAGRLFIPERGYTWVSGGTELRDQDREDVTVRWTPGQSSALPPHIHATTTEGLWEPDDGYQWTTGPQQPLSSVASVGNSAVWTPGLASSCYPNVVAASGERQWLPAPGYRWVNGDSKDYSVRRIFVGFDPGQ